MEKYIVNSDFNRDIRLDFHKYFSDILGNRWIECDDGIFNPSVINDSYMGFINIEKITENSYQIYVFGDNDRVGELFIIMHDYLYTIDEAYKILSDVYSFINRLDVDYNTNFNNMIIDRYVLNFSEDIFAIITDKNANIVEKLCIKPADVLRYENIIIDNIQ